MHENDVDAAKVCIRADEAQKRLELATGTTATLAFIIAICAPV